MKKQVMTAAIAAVLMLSGTGRAEPPVRNDDLLALYRDVRGPDCNPTNDAMGMITASTHPDTLLFNHAHRCWRRTAINSPWLNSRRLRAGSWRAASNRGRMRRPTSADCCRKEPTASGSFRSAPVQPRRCTWARAVWAGPSRRRTSSRQVTEGKANSRLRLRRRICRRSDILAGAFSIRSWRCTWFITAMDRRTVHCRDLTTPG
jgi:hypothetical protein